MSAQQTADISTRDIVVPCDHGVHLRVAARIVTQAREFRSRIWIERGVAQADAKSILSLLDLAARQGTPLIVRAKGPDAADAVQSIAELFAAHGRLCAAPTEH